MQLWEQLIRLQKEDGFMKQYQAKMQISNNPTPLMKRNAYNAGESESRQLKQSHTIYKAK